MFSRQARRCCSVVHQHGLWQWRMRSSTSFGGGPGLHFDTILDPWRCLYWVHHVSHYDLPQIFSTNFPACADPLICTCGDLGWANQWVRTTIVGQRNFHLKALEEMSLQQVVVCLFLQQKFASHNIKPALVSFECPDHFWIVYWFQKSDVSIFGWDWDVTLIKQPT